MSIARWSPLRELARMRDEMDRILDEIFGPIRERRIPFLEWTPAADIIEDEDQLVVRLEIPGMRKEDLSISLRENHLTVKGERKGEEEKKGRTYHRREFYYGSFERNFVLPASIDPEKVSATYENGILEIKLPKSEAVKPREIPIK